MVNYDDYAPTKKDIDMKTMPLKSRNSKMRKVLQTKRLSAERRASHDPDYISEDLRDKYIR